MSIIIDTPVIGADLTKYMTVMQLAAIRECVTGEEAQYFIDKLEEYAQRIEAMPVTYQKQEETNPFAHLHYFKHGRDWYITERDVLPEQHQAFGLVCLQGNKPESGYISIIELIANGVELDLYWTPTRLSELKKG